jgi:MFS family permease
MLLLGAGAGTCFPALMTLAMSGATQSDSGLASGLVNTTVQVGGAIGLAVLATLASEYTDALRADGESRAAALNAGYHLAYLIGAAAIVVAIVVAVVVVRSKAGTTAEDQVVAEAQPACGDAAYEAA